MSCCGCGSTSCRCGCCAGLESTTPESEFNRPGRSALQYRAGTHASFFDTMLADLSKDRRLDGLTGRESSDPSIALLDAWATVADVLTFYQERIANEGFLATATERRSVVELANLVGYRPRPGISASAFLAYTLDDNAKATIPAGSLVRSVPADGEAQQAFETSEPIAAEASWNNLQVRVTGPPTKASILTDRALYLKGVVTSIRKDDPLFVRFGPLDVALCRVLSVEPDVAADRTKVGLEEWAPSGKFQVPAGSALALANELRRFLHIEAFGLTLANATVKGVLPTLQQVVDILDSGSTTDFTEKLEAIRAFRDANPPRSPRASHWLDELLAINPDVTTLPGPRIPVSVDDIAESAGLLEPPSLAPRSQYHRSDDIQALFGTAATEEGKPPQISGSSLAALAAFRPAFRESLAVALQGAQVTPDPEIRVYSVVRAAAFGHNAAPRASTGIITATDHTGAAFMTTWSEWPLDVPADGTANNQGVITANLRKIDLEKEFDDVDPHTVIAVQIGAGSYTTPPLSTVSTASRAAYGLAGKTTRLTFVNDVLPTGDATLGLLRPVKVFIAADVLPLANQPIADPVCGSDPAIELDGLYDGLTPGRWMVVTGERTDTTGTAGVLATELLLIGDVQHRVAANLPGDRLHTFLRPAVPSAYCYKRETVKIYGNVVKATNGETRKEVLGSGDAGVRFQEFALKQSPLTHLAAATSSGTESTLSAFVNDVEWHEVDTPVGLAPYDRRFFTRTAEDGTTTVVFGNGVTGARLPTGNANVRAHYRNGIGKGGNVGAGQLTILGSKPFGVREVINPLRASGGADKDSRDQIRVNAPIAVTALDRLVSVRDYADFARTFAGIGKASAAGLTDGHRQVVHVTIAGVDDIPIDVTSDLYLNLRHAMHLFGDPGQPLQLDVRAARFLVLQAGVKVHPDYPWEMMAPALRAALLDAFRFDRRELGQSAFLSEVLDVLQRVPGVKYVDADKFGAISEEQLTPSAIAAAIGQLPRLDSVIAHLAESNDGISAAEIAYFTPDVPATIVLNQL